MVEPGHHFLQLFVLLLPGGIGAVYGFNNLRFIKSANAAADGFAAFGEAVNRRIFGNGQSGLAVDGHFDEFRHKQVFAEPAFGHAAVVFLIDLPQQFTIIGSETDEFRHFPSGFAFFAAALNDDHVLERTVVEVQRGAGADQHVYGRQQAFFLGSGQAVCIVRPILHDVINLFLPHFRRQRAGLHPAADARNLTVETLHCPRVIYDFPAWRTKGPLLNVAEGIGQRCGAASRRVGGKVGIHHHVAQRDAVQILRTGGFERIAVRQRIGQQVDFVADATRQAAPAFELGGFETIPVRIVTFPAHFFSVKAAEIIHSVAAAYVQLDAIVGQINLTPVRLGVAADKVAQFLLAADFQTVHPAAPLCAAVLVVYQDTLITDAIGVVILNLDVVNRGAVAAVMPLSVLVHIQQVLVVRHVQPIPCWTVPRFFIQHHLIAVASIRLLPAVGQIDRLYPSLVGITIGIQRAVILHHVIIVFKAQNYVAALELVGALPHRLFVQPHFIGGFFKGRQGVVFLPAVRPVEHIAAVVIAALPIGAELTEFRMFDNQVGNHAVHAERVVRSSDQSCPPPISVRKTRKS